jgi:hypothetical protein
MPRCDAEVSASSLLQGGGIISQVRDRTGAKVHMCDAEPGRPNRIITISLIDGARCIQT